MNRKMCLPKKSSKLGIFIFKISNRHDELTNYICTVSVYMIIYIQKRFYIIIDSLLYTRPLMHLRNEYNKSQVFRLIVQNIYYTIQLFMNYTECFKLHYQLCFVFMVSQQEAKNHSLECFLQTMNTLSFRVKIWAYAHSIIKI